MITVTHAIVDAMKLMIWLGITVGGIIGSIIGGLLDHGNWLGGWSILLSTAGSFSGLWVGYKLAKAYL